MKTVIVIVVVAVATRVICAEISLAVLVVVIEKHTAQCSVGLTAT